MKMVGATNGKDAEPPFAMTAEKGFRCRVLATDRLAAASRLGCPTTLQTIGTKATNDRRLGQQQLPSLHQLAVSAVSSIPIAVEAAYT